VVIVKLVSLFCVLKELSQMDRQQLVVLSTTRISPAPAVGVLAWAARRAQYAIYGPPVRRLSVSFYLCVSLERCP
jgi:hypothetical protein